MWKTLTQSNTSSTAEILLVHKSLNIYLLKQFLEANDVEVVLTRETGEGLYDADAANKKVQDMKRRIEVIESTSPVVTVSIHQNS